MMPDWPRAWGPAVATAVLRRHPEDFQVSEELGFELSGDGEHLYLHLEKRGLTSMELVQRLATVSGVPARDIGLAGLKDRNALTRQWFSLGMAGRAEPDWGALEATGDVRILARDRHARKLRRGVHRRNRFRLCLRELVGERSAIEQRLALLREQGVPNYFGEQRFGRDGSTVAQAERWLAAGGGRISRGRRSLFLSALRSLLWNNLLAERVTAGDWNRIRSGDTCLLQGSRSLFHCDAVDETLQGRAEAGDVHPGLPLWGRGATPELRERYQALLAAWGSVCDGLERAGLELAWRPARVLADDFSWQFCDDGSLQLDFALGAGAYATALLAEFVRYNKKQGT